MFTAQEKEDMLQLDSADWQSFGEILCNAMFRPEYTKVLSSGYLVVSTSPIVADFVNSSSFEPPRIAALGYKLSRAVPMEIGSI